MRLLTASIFGVTLWVASIGAQAPAMPKPGPEHQRLSAFVGTWTFDGELKPGPMGKGGKMTGTDRIQWMPGNFFLERRFDGTGPMGPMSGIEILGYDPAKKLYTFNIFDSTGASAAGTATVKGDTWSFTGTGSMGGKTMQDRCTLTFANPTTLKIACEMSGDGKSWGPTFAGTATKSK